MAIEKIEDVSTEVLLKRRRFIKFLVGIFVAVTVIWIGLIIYDLVVEGEIKSSSLTGLVPSLACIWIPLFMLSRVNSEINRRKENR